MIVFWVLTGLVVAVLAWIRLAPSDAARWHVMRDVVQERDMAIGVIRVIAAEPDTLTQLDSIIRATPRTRVLAGSVSEKMVSYVTRSALFGFPDYTTVRERDGKIEIFARLRFGRSDTGVNGRRVGQWLAALGR